MFRRILPAAALLLVALTLTAGEGGGKRTPLAALPVNVSTPVDNPSTPEKVALGKQLFFDPRLSGDNTSSCATCHVPEKAFGDGLAVAKGHRGKTLSRNTPALLNVAHFSRLLWDGRAKSVEEQALAPIQSPDEMNQKLDELEKELGGVGGYVEQFQKVFGTTVTRDGIAKALACFQRTLVTKPSPYDRFLAGDKSALPSPPSAAWNCSPAMPAVYGVIAGRC
jgi:cytochrome c peroxidase